MDPSVIAQLVRTGEDNIIKKYCSVSVATILIYDYFLILDDEVKSAFKSLLTLIQSIGFKPDTICLGTLPFSRGAIIPSTKPGLILDENYFVRCVLTGNLAAHGLITSTRCKRAICARLFFFVLFSLFAQIFIGIRAYALSRLNQKLLWTFLILGVVHVGLGAIIVYDGTDRVVHIPNIPLDPFRVCLYDHNKTIGITFEISILVFDTIALVSMAIEVSKYARHYALPSMLRAVIRDITVYFFTIFLSHLLFVITIQTARPDLKILPAVGLEVFMPVMISRLVLSLMEVADKTENMSEGGFTTMSFSTSFSAREADLDLGTPTLRVRRRPANTDPDAE
ncbi:hypothetical protein BDM02DRAFT_3186957 [Thelephora ganbajun]|uniref:Uncharacterized protein n=1 Tax=Thelephora ganbajun TaxID=370292 RepID=A0ACB6ZGB0_THEGA|nr:hypothetical protein BDM02DRAFT_3186957 [Thelephora ganbajun]